MTLCDPTAVRLSPQERTVLCGDILRFSLLLGREAQTGNDESVAAVTDPQADSSPWERLFLLVDLWPRLEASLRSIAASPNSATVSMPHSLPIQTVRGAPATLARLARHPADHRAWIQTTRQERPETPARLRESRPTHSVQTVPNRIATGFLEALTQEIQAWRRLALFCEEPTAITASAELSQRVRHWRRQSPFCECAAPAKSGPPLPLESLLRSAPAYHSLYTAILQYRSGLQVDWSESAVLRFPILEAWRLYEIWCFLRVGAALRDLGWQPFETDCLQIVQTGMRLRLAHGKASRIRFRAAGQPPASRSADAGLELLYQPLFASAHRTSMLSGAAYRSLSHVMQPDIALIRDGRLLLLDPKYRPYGEVGEEQEDVDKMHTYRDAIVRTDPITGQAVPAVDAAWCLFPGVPISPASARQEPLRTYPAPTLDKPFGAAGVGAVQVRPAAANTELTDLLRHWLEPVE